MKLIQINAWMGRVNGPLERFIAAQQADIICMQEVFLPAANIIPSFASQFNFLEEVREASGLQNEFFAKGWKFKLGTETIEAGSIILSRFPLSDHQEFHPFSDYHQRNNAADSHPNAQAWQACTVTLADGRTFSLANYHGYLEDVNGVFGIGTDKTMEVMQKVADRLSALPHPLIFCGDLNIWPESPAFQPLMALGLRSLIVEHNLRGTLSPLHRAPTENRLVATPDHILVSSDVQVSQLTVSDEIVSDHKALVLEFEI